MPLRIHFINEHGTSSKKDVTNKDQKLVLKKIG